MFVLVVNKFGGCSKLCLVVLIGFEKFLYKGNCEVSKELLPNFFQKPCSGFGYRLSYNHPNGVIAIGKEP